MATAKRRAIDQLRRRTMLDRKHAELGTRARGGPGDVRARPGRRGSTTRSETTCCASCSSAATPCCRRRRGSRSRCKLLGWAHHRGGGARLPRARADAGAAHRAREADASEAGVPFEVPPRRRAWPSGWPSVLAVVYLVFNEGYTATAGDGLAAPRAVPTTPCVSGACSPGSLPRSPRCTDWSRSWSCRLRACAARVGPSGEIVTLFDQDRSPWDRLLIRHGLGALRAGAGARRRARAVCAAGGDRGLPRPRGARRRTPTGSASSRSTTRCRSSCPRRWWS